MYTYDVYIYVKKTCALHNIKSLFYRKPPKSPVVSKHPGNVTAAVGELVRRSRHPTLHNVASCSFPNLKTSENIQFLHTGNATFQIHRATLGAFSCFFWKRVHIKSTVTYTSLKVR